MASTTAINALPTPDDNSPNDPPIHFGALNTQLDTRLLPRFATTAARDAAITSPVNGMACWVDATSSFYDRVSGVWVPENKRWQTYTPTWTMLTPAPFAVRGGYSRTGTTVDVVAAITGGPGTSLGTGAVTFSLPFTAATPAPPSRWSAGRGQFQATPPSSPFFELIPVILPGGTTCRLYTLKIATPDPLSYVNPGEAGYAWVNGSEMVVQVSYECVP